MLQISCALCLEADGTHSSAAPWWIRSGDIRVIAYLCEDHALMADDANANTGKWTFQQGERTESSANPPEARSEEP